MHDYERYQQLESKLLMTLTAPQLRDIEDATRAKIVSDIKGRRLSVFIVPMLWLSVVLLPWAMLLLGDKGYYFPWAGLSSLAVVWIYWRRRLCGYVFTLEDGTRFAAHEWSEKPFNSIQLNRWLDAASSAKPVSVSLESLSRGTSWTNLDQSFVKGFIFAMMRVWPLWCLFAFAAPLFLQWLMEQQSVLGSLAGMASLFVFFVIPLFLYPLWSLFVLPPFMLQDWKYMVLGKFNPSKYFLSVSGQTFQKDDNLAPLKMIFGRTTSSYDSFAAIADSKAEAQLLSRRI